MRKKFILFLLVMGIVAACDDKSYIWGDSTLTYLPMEFANTEKSVEITPTKKSFTVEFSKVGPPSTDEFKYEPINPILLTISDESTAVYGKHYSIANYDQEENTFEIKFDSPSSDAGEFSIDLSPDKITETVTIKIIDGYLGLQRLTITLVPED